MPALPQQFDWLARQWATATKPVRRPTQALLHLTRAHLIDDLLSRGLSKRDVLDVLARPELIPRAHAIPLIKGREGALRLLTSEERKSLDPTSRAPVRLSDATLENVRRSWAVASCNLQLGDDGGADIWRTRYMEKLSMGQDVLDQSRRTSCWGLRCAAKGRPDRMSAGAHLSRASMITHADRDRC